MIQFWVLWTCTERSHMLVKCAYYTETLLSFSKFKARFIIFIDFWWRDITEEKCLGLSAIFWIPISPEMTKVWISSMIPMSSLMDWNNAIYSPSKVLRKILDWNLDTQVMGHPVKIIMKSVRDLTQRGFWSSSTPQRPENMPQHNSLPVGSEKVQELKRYILCL